MKSLLIIIALLFGFPSIPVPAQFFGGAFKAREKAQELKTMQEARGILLELIAAQDVSLLPTPGDYSDAPAYFAALAKKNIAVGQGAVNWRVVEQAQLNGRRPLLISNHFQLSQLDADPAAAIKKLDGKAVLIGFTDGSVERIEPGQLSATVKGWKSKAKVLGPAVKHPD